MNVLCSLCYWLKQKKRRKELFCKTTSWYFTNLALNPKNVDQNPTLGLPDCNLVCPARVNNDQGKHTLFTTITIVTIQHIVPAILLIKPQQAKRLPISQITVATTVQSHQQGIVQCQTDKHTRRLNRCDMLVNAAMGAEHPP